MKVRLVPNLIRTCAAAAGGSSLAVPFFEVAELLEVACGALGACLAGCTGTVVLYFSVQRKPAASALFEALSARFFVAAGLLVAVLTATRLSFTPFALSFAAGYLLLLSCDTVVLCRLFDGWSRSGRGKT